jgi:hypothetical protein
VAIFSGSVRAWEVLTPCRVGLGAVLKNLTELKKSKVAESDVCTFFMNSTDFFDEQCRFDVFRNQTQPIPLNFDDFQKIGRHF